nr:uncharacterized protein LOC125423973 [Ziziphus jujuba var. spinosa]
MAFIISKAQSSLSEVQSNGRLNHEKDGKDSSESPDTGSHITSELYLRSSSKSLDKDVVLRRLRQHKSLNKIKGAFQALLSSSSEHANYADSVQQQKWVDQNDNFSSP